MKRINCLILICIIVACEGIVSEIECKSFSKDEPNYRSCVLSNVCYINKKWTFFDESNPKRTFEKLPLNVGTYDSSPKFNIDQVPNCYAYLIVGVTATY